MTLTVPTFNACRALFFLVTGAGKSEVLADILDGDEDLARLPAQRIQPIDGRTTWYLDEAAARRLR